MDVNIGIDSKPRTRRGRRRFKDRLVTLAGECNDDANNTIAVTDYNTLDVLVKERENGGARKGPLGGIFKDTPTTAMKGLFWKESRHDLKDTIKRPLTGLFRRSVSRANSNFGPKNENRIGTDIFVPKASNHGNEHIVHQSPETPCFEEVLHDVANVPSLNVNQISTVYQFDFMNTKNTSPSKLDDIEDEINDEKIPWKWDYLFANVSTEMRNEWMQDEEREDVDYEDENLIK